MRSLPQSRQLVTMTRVTLYGWIVAGSVGQKPVTSDHMTLSEFGEIFHQVTQCYALHNRQVRHPPFISVLCFVSDVQSLSELFIYSNVIIFSLPAVLLHSVLLSITVTWYPINFKICIRRIFHVVILRLP